ncbi:hexokinase-3-like protein [Cinnamomum micranthum f. kanehirae]|uniref:Phosphotransferase n=1 Tax=Cinnamomum micranthum f. kanehirae TaxID=337451 RepID=A0A3S3M2Y3_9MAGN|nr:hexokinase-3-like protein [Cinnamomum micranthum f. kanehirae]
MVTAPQHVFNFQFFTALTKPTTRPTQANLRFNGSYKDGKNRVTHPSFPPLSRGKSVFKNPHNTTPPKSLSLFAILSHWHFIKHFIGSCLFLPSFPFSALPFLFLTLACSPQSPSDTTHVAGSDSLLPFDGVIGKEDGVTLREMGKVALGLAVGSALASCAIAAILVSRRVKSRRKWNKVVGVLKEFEEGCSTSIGRLRQVVDAMAVEMHAGLASEGGSKLKMLLTFIDNLPNGSERGNYYALDLGGSDFRVLRIQLRGERSTITEPHVEQQPIPQHLMTSTSEGLFDFIASALERFLEREGDEFELPSNKKELGFTFPFPVRQLSVSSGILFKWTKGFAIEDMGINYNIID